MYIWKTKALATDIKNSVVGQREWKKYYLATSIFLMLGTLIPQEDLTSWTAQLIEMVALIGITIFGVNVTYQSNKGDDGIDYIARMTALSIPIFVKFILLIVLAGILLGILIILLSILIGLTVSDLVMYWGAVGLRSILTIAFFWRLNIHIKYINT